LATVVGGQQLGSLGFFSVFMVGAYRVRQRPSVSNLAVAVVAEQWEKKRHGHWHQLAQVIRVRDALAARGRARG